MSATLPVLFALRPMTEVATPWRSIVSSTLFAPMAVTPVLPICTSPVIATQVGTLEALAIRI